MYLILATQRGRRPGIEAECEDAGGAEAVKLVRIFPNEHGGYHIVVDGTDVSGFVHKDGVVIEFRDGQPFVTLPLAPHLLHLTLPDALVNALSPDEEGGGRHAG